MTFVYGFLVGAAAASAVWKIFHAKIVAELASMKKAVANGIKRF